MGGCCSWLFGRRAPRTTTERDPLLPRPPPVLQKPQSPRVKEPTSSSTPTAPRSETGTPAVLCTTCLKAIEAGQAAVTAGSKRYESRSLIVTRSQVCLGSIPRAFDAILARRSYVLLLRSMICISAPPATRSERRAKHQSVQAA